jgi:hypothetical protein
LGYVIKSTSYAAALGVHGTPLNTKAQPLAPLKKHENATDRGRDLVCSGNGGARDPLAAVDLRPVEGVVGPVGFRFEG